MRLPPPREMLARGEVSSNVLVLLHYFLMSGCSNYSGMLFLLAASNVYALKYVFWRGSSGEVNELHIHPQILFPYMCLLIQMSYSHIQEVLTRKFIRLLFAVWPRWCLGKCHHLTATLKEETIIRSGIYLSELPRVLRGFSFFKIWLALTNLISTYFFTRPLAATLDRKKIKCHYLSSHPLQATVYWIRQMSLELPLMLCAHYTVLCRETS